MDFKENTLHYFEKQNNDSLHFECGGGFDIDVIPVLLEMFETHLLNDVVSTQNLENDYGPASMGLYEEKERLEILLDKIKTTGSADEFDTEKKEIEIGNYYKYFSILKPYHGGKVFRASGLVPAESAMEISDKVKMFTTKLIEDIGNLGYNPTKVEKSILQ